MEQYIKKSALVAEMEKLRDELQEKVETSDFIAGEVFIMNYFISLLDFIEVKEVNESLTWKDVSALRLTSHDAIELDGTEIAPPIDSDVCG